MSSFRPCRRPARRGYRQAPVYERQEYVGDRHNRFTRLRKPGRLHYRLGLLPAVLLRAICASIRTQHHGPELTSVFDLTTLGVGSLLGLYYYTYSNFSIVAGASLDCLGAKYMIPAGIVITAVGSVLFGLGSHQSGRTSTYPNRRITTMPHNLTRAIV